MGWRGEGENVLGLGAATLLPFSLVACPRDPALPYLDHLLEERDELVDIVNLGVSTENSRGAHLSNLALLVLDEVGGDKATVNGETLGELNLIDKGLGLLNDSGPSLPNLVEGGRDDPSHLDGAGSDGSDVAKVFNVGNGLGKTLDLLSKQAGCLADANVEGNGVDTGSDGTHTLVHNLLGHESGGSGSISSLGVGLGSDFLNEASAHIHLRICKGDLTGDGNTIVDNLRSTIVALKHNVLQEREGLERWVCCGVTSAFWVRMRSYPALRPKGNFDCVSNSIDP